MTRAGALLKLSDLSVEFRAQRSCREVVANVGFHVDRGETLIVLGESGSGKSVTASAIMSILDVPPARITSGRIEFENVEVLSLPARERRDLNGRRMAMIFQDPLAHLNPVLTVGQQIAEVFEAHGVVPPRGVRAEVIELLDRVGIPDPETRIDHYPHQFSGGQRQRVMIAMALALKPQLLIADEPTTALDVTVQAEILRLLKQLQADYGMGLILITHDFGVAARMGDRVAVMLNGRIVETGTVSEVFQAPQHEYTRRLVAAARRKASVTVRKPEARTGETILRVSGLSKHYTLSASFAVGGLVRAVNDVSFEVERGKTLGIVGESGSGKSTIARTLMRLETATSGTAELLGRDLFAAKGADLRAIRRKMQMIFQDPYSSLNPYMRVDAIIGEPLMIHRDALDRSARRDRVAEMLKLVELGPDFVSRYPHQLSGGQRQRVAIARSLVCNSELLICDEAVSALDVVVQSQIMDLLTRLQESMGLAYIFITHDMHLVRSFAHSIIVMKSGEVMERGPTEQVFSAPRHPYTRALIAASLDVDVAAGTPPSEGARVAASQRQ